jgi:hypothetical protein
MFCEFYREALKEAALNGEQLPAQLEAHLEACVPCRVVFSGEKALLGRMESELAALVNAEAPSSLLPKVRAQITARDNVPSLRAAHVYGTLFAALLGIAFVFVARTRPPTRPHAGFATTSSAVIAGASTVPRSDAGQRQEIRAPRKLNHPPARQERVEPEVLISADERIGLQGYQTALRARAIAIQADAANGKPEAIKPLEIAELNVKQLTIEPLASEKPENDSTKR